jgi:hypoxanthine phosphoribosyltransferase|tara:strand:- start:579 stop:1466 length:888 start_codon:yes stop_codon:yes gene_type:complete
LALKVHDPLFAHPSESEFAQILDFYGIEWDYEPASFPTEYDGERVVEMFTPDFYLPQMDLYIELTTLKQSLITRKNRKLRRIRELNPDINIRLLYRRDFHRLMAKFGFGPLGASETPVLDRVLFGTGQIAIRVGELGREISTDYDGKDPVLVGVLRGVFCFMADLIRQTSVPMSVDFMSVSYYEHDETTVKITKELDIDLEGRHVLMVEDIVDTGMTLNYLLEYLRSKNPASLEVCTLLDKKARRLTDPELKYVGFEAPDEFVVGYGLDYIEEYRNLPFIGSLRVDAGDAANKAK